MRNTRDTVMVKLFKKNLMIYDIKCLREVTPYVYNVLFSLDVIICVHLFNRCKTECIVKCFARKPYLVLVKMCCLCKNDVIVLNMI